MGSKASKNTKKKQVAPLSPKMKKDAAKKAEADTNRPPKQIEHSSTDPYINQRRLSFDENERIYPFADQPKQKEKLSPNKKRNCLSRKSRPPSFNNNSNRYYDGIDLRAPLHDNRFDYFSEDRFDGPYVHHDFTNRDEFPVKIYDTRRFNNYDRHHSRPSRFNHLDMHQLCPSEMEDLRRLGICNEIEYSVPARFDCAPVHDYERFHDRVSLLDCMAPPLPLQKTVIRNNRPPKENFLDYSSHQPPPSNFGLDILFSIFMRNYENKNFYVYFRSENIAQYASDFKESSSTSQFD
jgi:hypothetical protein